MPDKIKILCTLGPSSMNKKTVRRMDDLGVDIFRINLSHTDINKLKGLIVKIRGYTDKPICLDTEGAQVRTGYVMNDKIYLKEGGIIELTKRKVMGDYRKISLNPNFIIEKLKPGDLISVDFNSVLLQVIQSQKDALMARVISSGNVGSNKAVTIDRYIKLPVVSKKDKTAIRIGERFNIRHYALSFADSKESVEKFRGLVGRKAQLISKIESREGVRNLEGILKVSDAILIDRGDLSREEPIEKIPFIQKWIIKKANSAKIPVYVATNLLESMVKDKKPTRAETNDVVNTLIDGADGLVLAAETAIGSYPINCTVMISKIIKQYLDFSKGTTILDLQKKDYLSLVEPHGGVLVNRLMDNSDREEIKSYKKLMVNESTLVNAEQIAIGTFSPLEGFMTKKELDSVLRNYRLPNGYIWPLPILLQLKKEDVRNFKVGEKIALVFKDTGVVHAVLHIEDIYGLDLDKTAKEIFLTGDCSHAGVDLFKNAGGYFIGGKLNLIKRLRSEWKHYEITPLQARTIFENIGWSRIVGFHTRNVIHNVHEYIQLLALEKYHCDGLFVHPVIGHKKKGDYSTDVILRSYDLMLQRYYPRGRVVLGAFQSYSRYAGPREAVFTALCRKNFGCTHFIVGRDHAGVGNFYNHNDAHKLFGYLGDIGIVPIFFNEFYYCKKCAGYTEKCKHNSRYILRISGSEARRILLSRKAPPGWFMRKEISKLILKDIKQGRKVFVE